MKTITAGPLIISALIAAAGSAHGMASHQTIATELQEVRRSVVAGRDYLTIRIPGSIGPRTCHGNVLAVDTAGLPSEQGSLLMETVALEAMLTAESVMITVPTASDQCVDGKPTVTDMYLLPRSHTGSP